MGKKLKWAARELFLLLALFLTLSLALLSAVACQPAGPPEEEGGKLDLVATLFPPYDFARQIGGDHVAVSMLLPPGTESHTYEPTPKEVVRIAECDLFFYNGGISDGWVERLLEAAGLEPSRTVRMMDYVDLLEEAEEGILEDDHDQVPHLHDFDEHIWTAPLNALRISEGIADRLAELDSRHAADYKANFDAYASELRQLDESFRAVVREGYRREIIVADRFPLIYFTDAYGLDYTAAFPGCAAETDPKPKTVAGIIDRVREDKFPYIFHIEFSNEKLADLIAEETGARKLLFHTAHNVSKEELEAGVSYLSLMRQNAEKLRLALGE